MRRWLSILLLITLTVQWTWAAAAVYCQHETGPNAGHIGHHQHEHKAAAADTDDAKTASQDAAKVAKLLGDNDCGYCHLNAAKPLQAQAFAPMPVSKPASFDFAVTPLQSRYPERLERPNWCVSA